MPNIAIKIENISKSFRIPQENRNTLREHFWNLFHPTKYKKFEVLKSISLRIEKGQWLGIIGNNGSGKSTLLKIIAGIYEPDEGKIKINGRLVPFLELGVGFNPELSARENIFLNGTILGVTRKELEKKFDQIVDFAEIRQFLDLPLKNFSSGMQVRLAFAIAIQAEADIYLLDEVLAVGDMIFQKKCKKVFYELKHQKKTVIFVSHNINEIKNFCDKIAWLERGKIKEYGSVLDIAAKYLNK